MITSCLSSTEEFGTVGIYYFYTLKEPLKIVYNIIYDMGEIYDDIRVIIDLSRKFARMTDIEVKEFGATAGRLFNMIFFDPADYNEYENRRQSHPGRK